MSAEIRPGGNPEPAWSIGGVLRHPDGSMDIRAYAAIAHRQRAEAIQAFMRTVFQSAGEAWSAIAARAVRSERPVSGKDCVQMGR